MRQAAIGYANQPRDMDPRSTEAWALAEASRRLMAAARADDKGESLREALRLNQRLWSIFQASLIDPECALPKDIRDNVLALSVLMDRNIIQRLADLDGSKIDPIIAINRAIAEGLSMSPAEGAPQSGVSEQAGKAQPGSVQPGMVRPGAVMSDSATAPSARPILNVSA